MLMTYLMGALQSWELSSPSLRVTLPDIIIEDQHPHIPILQHMHRRRPGVYIFPNFHLHSFPAHMANLENGLAK